MPPFADLAAADVAHPIERQVVDALAFQHDLARVETPAIRQRMVDTLAHVDARLARKVADALGLVPDAGKPGHPPYRVVYDDVISRPGFRRFVERHDLDHPRPRSAACGEVGAPASLSADSPPGTGTSVPIT